MQERKSKDLWGQILVRASSESIVPADTWLRCRKKLLANITFQGGRKARNTWLARNINCGRWGYALIRVGNPAGTKKLSEFQTLTAKAATVNPKLTALNVELVQVEDEIEKPLNTLPGANVVLLSYANGEIEKLDTRRQRLIKEIAALNVRTYSPPASGRRYCLRQSCIRSGRPQRMRTASWRGCGLSTFSLPGKSEITVLQLSDRGSSCPFSPCRAIQRS